MTNKSGAAVDLGTYQLHSYPTSANEMATASIVTASGAPFGTLANDAHLVVWLRSNATPASNQARVNWAAGSLVQSGAGELALFNGPAAATLVDYVKWGKVTDAMDEPWAIQMKLWQTGTSIATPSALPASASVITEGATGSVNWKY